MTKKTLEVPTPLTYTLTSAGKGIQYDEASKKALSDKDILAWILKKCVREYKNIPVKDIRDKYIVGKPEVGITAVMPDEQASVSSSGTEDGTIHEGTVRYDIRFVALVPGTKEHIELIINIEAQAGLRSEYPLLKRVVYYGCRLVSSQRGTEFKNQEYGKIKKCYTIWIVMNPPKERQNTITRYSITEEHLVGEFKEDVENYDLMEGVVICLGPEEQEEYDELLKLLATLLSKNLDIQQKKAVLEQEFDIAMSETLEGEVLGMCNLSEGLIEYGFDKGIEKGAWSKAVEGAKKFLTLGVPIETISEGLDLPLETVQDIAAGKAIEAYMNN